MLLPLAQHFGFRSVPITPLTLPDVAAHCLGRNLAAARVRPTHLLDTAPLQRTVHRAIDSKRLEDNIP